MSFIEEIKQRAKADRKTIVLPEAMDSRVLQAAQIILSEGVCNIILLGDEQAIKAKAAQENISLEGAQLINSHTYEKQEEYAKLLAQIDQTVSFEEAKQLIKNPVYFGMMMVKSRR